MILKVKIEKRENGGIEDNVDEVIISFNVHSPPKQKTKIKRGTGKDLMMDFGIER
ncbi:MAG: hypothetical protein IJK96_01020 [Bacteroidales bacterium]|nr:hypothetical protein [Bacteroidales bacterium]